MKKIIKIIGGILLIGVLIAIGLYGYVYTKLEQIQVVEEESVDDEAKDIRLNEFFPEIKEGVHHILLIGTDHRIDEKGARSDAVILFTLDDIADNIKLTSFARDTYVEIPGHGYDKLTHAYAYGKNELLLETMRKNFNIGVKDYVAIDFMSFITVVDLIEGIPIEIENLDLVEFNRVSRENYDKFYPEKTVAFEKIDEDGLYNLNGYQTLAYVRMRKTDGIYARDERQREVVQRAVKKIMELPITSYPKLFEEILPYVATNMDPTTLMKIGLRIIDIGIDDLRQMEFPGEKYGTGTRVEGAGWVLQWEEEAGRALLKEFLDE